MGGYHAGRKESECFLDEGRTEGSESNIFFGVDFLGGLLIPRTSLDRASHLISPAGHDQGLLEEQREVQGRPEVFAASTCRALPALVLTAATQRLARRLHQRPQRGNGWVVLEKGGGQGHTQEVLELRSQLQRRDGVQTCTDERLLVRYLLLPCNLAHEALDEVRSCASISSSAPSSAPSSVPSAWI